MSLLGGSALWVFENTVCGVHGEGRGGWPMQWAHLHALWHLGACMGTYYFIQFNAARRGTALGARVAAGGGENLLMPLYTIHQMPPDEAKQK